PEQWDAARERLVARGLLDETEIEHGMWFEECWFDQSVRLYGAATRTIEIKASQLPGLNLTMARVEGRVALRRTVLNGRLELMNTRLTGELSHLASVGAGS
ncbi:hypothetical protein ACWCOW_37070, partial [Streptomyces sp. NPDC001939]